MAWVKLESTFPFNHKIADAGPVAAFLDICGWCYCRQHGTDGFIPDAHIGMLGPVPDPRKHARRLVEVGRWHRDDELRGWWVHDFLEFNPTEEAERAAAAARSSKASDAARARWKAKKAKPDAHGDARSIAQPVPGECSDDAPLPSLSLVTESVGTSGSAAPAGSNPEHRSKQRPPWNRSVL